MAGRLTRSEIARRFVQTISNSTSHLGLLTNDRAMIWGILRRMEQSRNHKKCKHKGQEGAYCTKCGKPRTGEQHHKNRGMTEYLGVLAIGAAFNELFDHLDKHKRKLKRETFSEEEFNALRAQFESRLETLPTALRKGLDEMKKNLPRRGGPGRKAKLSRGQEIEVCEQITPMIKADRLRLADIFEVVKETFKAKGIEISAQTVKRTWQKRKELYS